MQARIRAIVAMEISDIPPNRSRAAIDRTKILSSCGSVVNLVRSPSKAPPDNFDEGSTATTPTDLPCLRHSPIKELVNVDLPTPGGPVKPTTLPTAFPTALSKNLATSSVRKLDSISDRARANASFPPFRSSTTVVINYDPVCLATANWAAANRAIGTRNGEQDT